MDEVINNTAKKRKRVEPPDKDCEFSDMDDLTEETQEFPYILNKIKALQKKLDATTQENSVTFKGNANNLQLVVVCNTALYELLKSTFKSSLQEQGLSVSSKSKKDKAKSTVAVVMTVRNKKKGKHLFTANFYNTTSTLLVNGIKEPNKFLEQYSNIVNSFPESTVNNLNELIKNSCNDAISSVSKTHEKTCGSAINLPNTISDTNTASTKSDTSFSSMDLNDPQEGPSSVVPDMNVHSNLTTNECSNCNVLSGMVAKLLEKIDKISETQSVILRRLNQTEGIVHNYIKEEVSSLTDIAKSTIKSTLECCSDKLLSSIKNIPHNSNSHCYMTSESNSDVVMDTSPSTSSKVWSKVPKQVKEPPTNKMQHKSSLSVNATHQRTVKFKPDHCVVVSCTKAENMRSLNYDKIRHTLSDHHGPMMIDHITRYKFQSENPRYMIQLSRIEDASRVVNEWVAGSFGGSTARLTIKPDSGDSTGMMRGVPLDISESVIQQATENVYKGSTAVRLVKDNRKLHTIKISFANNVMLEDALKNGITIPSCNMIFRVEHPYPLTKSNSRSNTNND